MKGKAKKKGLSKKEIAKAAFPYGIGISFDDDKNVRVQISHELYEEIQELSSDDFPVGIWIQKEVLKELATVNPDADKREFYYRPNGLAVHAQGPVGNCDCRRK